MTPRIAFVTANSSMISCNGLTANRTLLGTRVNTNVTAKNKTFQVEGPVGVGVITDSTRKVAIATSEEHKMADLSPVAKMVK